MTLCFSAEVVSAADTSEQESGMTSILFTLYRSGVSGYGLVVLYVLLCTCSSVFAFVSDPERPHDVTTNEVAASLLDLAQRGDDGDVSPVTDTPAGDQLATTTTAIKQERLLDVPYAKQIQATHKVHHTSCTSFCW